MQPPPPFDSRQPEAQPLHFDPGKCRWQPHPQQHWSCPPHVQGQSFSAAYGGHDQPYHYSHDQEFMYPMNPQHGYRRHYDEGQQYVVGQQGRWYPDDGVSQQGRWYPDDGVGQQGRWHPNEPNPMHNFSQCGDESSWHGKESLEPSGSSPEPNRTAEDLSGPHWVSFDDKSGDKSLYPSRQEKLPRVDSATSVPPRTEASNPLDSIVCVTTAEEESVTRLDYKGSFLAKVKKFMVRNSEAFDALTKGATHPAPVPTLHNLSSEDSFKYAEPAALEYHMQVNRVERRMRFFELVSVGDIVRGHVIAKKHSGLMVQVTSFVKSQKMRELTDLTIKGLISFDNLTVRPDKKGEVLDEMQLEDVVQAVVVGVEDEEEETLSLSLRGDHLPIPMLDMYLGYMEGETPLRPRRGDLDEEDFLLHLKQDPGFTNPHCVDNLKSVLGITTSFQPSLLRDTQLAHYPESDFSDALRKTQRWKWSMETVATGVKHFKAGEHGKAMKYFDHALDIDSENVEGLVARGALFANNGKYRQAIANFEAALTLKHTHKNARKYLVETQVAYGQELEKEGNMDRAMRCYREALADNPEEETARVRLDILTAAAEKQAAEQKELERKKMEEKATLKKLHKIIEKEKKKKTKKPTHKKRKKTSKKQKRKERRQSRKEHTRYSSDETSASTASYYSDSSRTLSPESPKRRKHRKSGDRSRSRSRSESPSDRRGRRTRATPSPEQSSRKARRKKRHHQSESDRPRTPSPEHYKSRRQRGKYSDRSRSSSAGSHSSRSRLRSASSRRKKTAHVGSVSPSRKHGKQHSDKKECHARRKISSSSSGDHSNQRSKKHSH